MLALNLLLNQEALYRSAALRAAEANTTNHPAERVDSQVAPLHNLQNKNDAVIVSLSGKDPSISKLEKHLDDYQKGKGYLSKDVSKELKSLHHLNSNELSQGKPGQLKSYLAYSTGMNYQQRSRYVHAVNEMSENLKNLHRIA